MCLVGRMVGSSRSVPMATWKKAPSRTTEKRNEHAQLAARVVAVFVAKDREVVLALGDVQLVALDASE